MLQRAGMGLIGSPCCDPAMVTAHEDLRNPEAPPLDRLRVHRPFEKTLHHSRSKGVIRDARRIAEDARNEPHHRLNDDKRRSLAPCKHVVANGHLMDACPVAARTVVLDDPRVDALVTPAGEHQPRLITPLLSDRLGEALSRRGGDDEQRPDARDLPDSDFSEGDVIEGFTPWNRTHDHAGAPAIGSIVNGPVAIMGKGPEVMDPEIDETGVNCLADERQSQRIKVLGKDRDDIDPHG